MYNVLLYLVCLLLFGHMQVELKSNVFVHGSLGVTKFKLPKLLKIICWKCFQYDY
jgi:hypothetical protein